jgi:acyl-CoA synthetase (NDP forming)
MSPPRPDALSVARPALEPLLRARSLAVVGASAKRGTFGHALLRQALDSGYTGDVFAVNPGRAEIDGVRCYPSLADLPGRVECAVLAVADERLEEALTSVVTFGIPAAVIFGAIPVPGLAKSLPERLQGIARDAGIALLGGNCMGFYNYRDRLLVSGYPVFDRSPAGGIAIVSHSGSSFSALANSGRGLRFSYLISPGQELALTAADCLRFLVEQEETGVVGLFLETVRDPAGFVAALEAAAQREVPIVALKVGRSDRGRAMALAHSGAMAGSDEAFAALCERWGVIQVRSLDEMADALELLAAPRRPRRGGLALAGDSGGERALIVDRAAELEMPWAALCEETLATIGGVLEPGLAAANPLDLWGSGKDWQRIYETCLTAMAQDTASGITVLAVDLVPGSRLAPDYVEIVLRVQAATAAPMAVLGNMSTTIDRTLASRLRAGGVPVLMGTETGLAALRHALTWIPAHPREPMPRADEELACRSRELLTAQAGPLDEVEAKRLLDVWGIPVVAERLVETERQALAAARELGWPVVLKTASPGLMHKSDAGGVLLGLGDEDAVKTGFAPLHQRFKSSVVVQQQIALVDKIELFLGMTVDPQFGPLLSMGLGGIWVEVLRDTVVALPPIDCETAERLMCRLRGAPLLFGLRGRPAVDIQALTAAIVAFSRMAAALGPDLAEVDVNPLLAGPNGVIAVDALIVPRSDREAESP